MLRQRQPGVKALQKANKTLLNLQKEVYLTRVNGTIKNATVKAFSGNRLSYKMLVLI
jgi:hypothetical protein